MTTLAIRSGPAIDDRSLAAAIAEGDRSALETVYREHGRGVLGAALAVVRDRERAEDVVQDVFLRLWRSPERFDPERGALGTFLKVDARGRALDALRAERALLAKEDRIAAADSSEPVIEIEQEVMSSIVSAQVRSALSALRPEEGEPIALAYLGGHSYREVARVLDVPEGTVKSRIRMGLERLESLLRPAWEPS